VVGQLGRFQILVLVNSAAINMSGSISDIYFTYFGYIPSIVIAAGGYF
jgi:hypothetical protein